MQYLQKFRVATCTMWVKTLQLNLHCSFSTVKLLQIILIISFTRQILILPASAIYEQRKYWVCKLRIGVAKFQIRDATATSKDYKV